MSDKEVWDEDWRAVVVDGSVELHVGERQHTAFMMGIVEDDWDEDYRRAVLMAAAPDLYRAITAMIECLDGQMCCYEGRKLSGPMEEARELAHAALRKARGET